MGKPESIIGCDKPQLVQFYGVDTSFLIGYLIDQGANLLNLHPYIITVVERNAWIPHGSDARARSNIDDGTSFQCRSLREEGDDAGDIKDHLTAAEHKRLKGVHLFFETKVTCNWSLGQFCR